MRVTLVHPCIGRREGQAYIKTWQMEPLPPAMIAGLTPPEVEVRFFDDRIEPVGFDEPTDLVAISVETYTARRAYQIASAYRRRGVPVVMGGFHATLRPREVARYAESVVVGEAEEVWSQVLNDADRGTLATYYAAERRAPRAGVFPNRSIYTGKRYLPLGLVEATRGCRFGCEFCAIQSAFGRTQTSRPVEDVVADIAKLGKRRLIFFVDDNIGADPDGAKELFRALAPLGISWVGQISITAAFDEELLTLMKASGCQGVLIGFESLNPATLKRMNKSFNLMGGGYEEALRHLRRHGIRLYVTFVFGYDEDTPESFSESVRFATDHRFFIAAFNHLTPFPGTPLYERLEHEGRLLYDAWWLDERYGYNMIPFQPVGMTPVELETGCVEARAAFYRWRSIWDRGRDSVNQGPVGLRAMYYWINYLLRREVRQRQRYPLGDAAWAEPLIEVRSHPEPPPRLHGALLRKTPDAEPAPLP